jgi:ribonuclease BN (tRNA processing enzyme)
LHPDHCSDLLAAFNWTINMPNAPRLPVYGPIGWADRLAAMIPSDNATDLVNRAFEIHELRDQQTIDVGDMRFSSLAVEHSVPAFGLRAEHAGRVIAYSGDTGPCTALTNLAEGADIFVCEAGATDPQRAHCTPYEAGHAAAKTRSKKLVLTHIAQGISENRAIEAAAGIAGFTVEYAAPGLHLAL